MTVAQLIELLKTFPQDIPVTGYNGQEETEFVTEAGINLRHTNQDHVTLYKAPFRVNGKKYEGPFLDIMGY